MKPTRLRRFIQPVMSAASASVATSVASHETPAAIVAGTVQEVPPSELALPPGLAEDSHFDLDASVRVWKNFQRDGPKPAIANLQEASSIILSIASGGADGRRYALAHGLRTGYFSTNAVLGLLSSELDQRFRGSQGGGLGFPLGPAEITRMLLEAAMCYEQDHHSIRDGLYKPPWDMFTPNHRQLQPQYAASETARFIVESIATIGRRARGGLPEDIGIWLESPLYPDYYKNNFHYQTDGWMSSHSADVYETSTETLFIGRQDAMQRLSLPPLQAVALSNGGSPRILEVAGGTGRFATFIRDNHPSAKLTVVDLSPFYLQSARENDEYWRKTRYLDKETRPPPATFVQAAAEALPFENASFDAVVCVYLFHEMPEAARAAAAAEMSRVVAPGGVVVLTDSIQRGDRPALDNQIGMFSKLNEPHYVSYASTYLPALFTSGGLTCDRKWVESTSKCISFRKPATEGASKRTSISNMEVVPSKQAPGEMASA